MNTLQNYLQNLLPGGASNIPKSKLDQMLTHDSELDSPEPQQSDKPTIESETKPTPNEAVKVPRKTIVKQTADVHQESSEFEDIEMASIPISEPPIVATNLDKPLPKPRRSLSKPEESDYEDIKKIWENLKIGKDGYLTLHELEKLCNYLEMNEMDKKDIQNLFLVIDTDKDNKVSVSEFSIGLKTHGSLKKAVDKMDANVNIKKRPQHSSMKPSHALIPSLALPNGRSTSLFSALDPNEKNFCDEAKIVEYWASSGFLNGSEVLEYLNFKPDTTVNLVELSVLLEKEIYMADLDDVTLAGLITYQKELYHGRSMIDELLERIMKLNKEISITDYENSQLKNRIAEVQEINILQEEELDAVAELHRNMELELGLLRDTKLIFNQTMTKSDRDELYELKRKFEQHFETSNNSSLRRISQTDNINGHRNNSVKLNNKLCLSEKKVNELQRKLQLKLDEVHYLKKEIDDSRFHRKEKAFEDNSKKFKDLERSVSAHMKRSEELKEDNERLQHKIQSLESKIDIAINREKAYKMRIEAVEKEAEKEEIFQDNIVELNNTLNDTTKSFERKLEKCSKKIEDLQIENKELNKSCHNMEIQLEKMKEEKMRESESLRKKNRQIDNHKNEIADFNDRLKCCREDARINKMIIDKLEMANDRLSKSIKGALQKIDEFSQQNFDSDIKNELNENIKMHKENMILEDEVSQLNRRLAEMELFQVRESNTEIQNLLHQIKEKDKTLEELEEELHKKSADLRCDRFGSAKKIEKLQFKYEELNKKYQLQLEQVDKSDSLLKDLYEENTKLVKSLQRSDTVKEQNGIKIIQLEEKVKTLQNILNRAP